MKNRLQLRYHIENPLPTREEAINYINNIFYNDANDGLTSLIAEPLVVFYNNDTTLKNRRRSIESANVILAIGRGGDGTNVEKNKDYFIIDFAKNVEDINKINEIIGDVNDDKSKSSIYGLITKNLESIENEKFRAEEVEAMLFQSIEDTKNQLLKDINDDLRIRINEESSRAKQVESALQEQIDNNKTSLEEQITKNKVISSDKTITFNTNSSNTDISVNVDTDSINIDKQTGRLSVKPEAFIKYDGENAIQINDKENYTKEISLIINQDDQILSNETNGLKCTLSLDYVKDDENKPLLRLIGKDNETISSINVSDFINVGMIQSVDLKEEQDKKYLVITWNTTAGKEITTLDISSLIDVYTAGNGIKLNNGEFSIKLKENNDWLISDDNGLYFHVDKLEQTINESLTTTSQNITSNLESIIKSTKEDVLKDAKHYTDDEFNVLDNNIRVSSKTVLDDAKNYVNSETKKVEEKLNTKITANQNVLTGYLYNDGTTSYTTVKDDIKALQGTVNDTKESESIKGAKLYTDEKIKEAKEVQDVRLDEIEEKLDTIENGAQVNVIETIKIDGNVINRNGKEVNIPLNEDFEATTEGISISNNFKNKITNDNNNTLESAKKYTDTKIEPLDAILEGYGVGGGETLTVKRDIASLQEQIDNIHTHDNKEVLDGVTAEKVSAWDDAEQNAKDYADNKIKEATDAQVLVDTAQDDRLTTIEGILTEKETKWDGAVSKIDTFLADADLTENAVDTLKELQSYIESDGSAAKELISRVATNEAILEGYGTGEGETQTVIEHIEKVNSALTEYKTKVGDIQTLNLTADEFKENKTFLIMSGLYKTKDGILFCDTNNWGKEGIRLTHIENGKVKTCHNTNTPLKDNDIIIWSDWADYYSVLNEKIDDVEAILAGFGKEEDDVYETVMGVFRKQALVDAAQNTILEGYGVGEGETPTVKSDINNLQGQVDALKNTLIGTDEDTKDSDSIKGAKKYTDEKIQDVIENIGTLNGDINTIKNGVQLINDVDKCGLLFTKGDKQRLITFDGIIERLFDNETNKWENNWKDFVTWGNNLPTEPTTPEVSGQTLDIKNNATVSGQTLDIKNNATVENKILTINK